MNLANGSTNPADLIGVAYCQICNPFQYARSIMGDPVQRAAHIKDTADLLSDIDHDTLPAVSFAKPDGLLDGHPQSSKLGLFEAYLRNILDRPTRIPLKAKTAVFIVFDEGGYWDSGRCNRSTSPATGHASFLAISKFCAAARWPSCFTRLDPEIHRAQLAPEAAYDPQPGQPAQSIAPGRSVRAGRHAGDRRSLRHVQLRRRRPRSLIAFLRGRLARLRRGLFCCNC